MHAFRQWMSSVALVATAGLVIVAARQHLQTEEPLPPPSAPMAKVPEPPRLTALPARANPLVEAAGTTRVTQHTYPIREPSAEARQPWKGELPLDDLLPARRSAIREPAPRYEESIYDERPANPTRTRRAPVAAPREERVEEYAAEPYQAPPARTRRPVREEQQVWDEAERPEAPPRREPRAIASRRANEYANPQQNDRESLEEEALPEQPRINPRKRAAQPDDYATQAPGEVYRQPQPQFAPRQGRPNIDLNTPSMRAVLDKAREHTRHGFSLAQRGAIFSARSEFVQALRLVTQSIDTQTNSDMYGRALASGLKALEEADDFAPRGSNLEAHLDLAGIVDSHDTPVLKDVPVDELNSLRALQAYYAYAREKLALASGQTVAGSEALYALGKLQTESARLEKNSERLHQAKGMVYHQAALDADQRNYQAANELAVLLARHGQFETAKRLLVHSVQLLPQAEVWRNLATVHTSLGEQDLAQRAEYELRLLQPQTPTSALAGQVQWVDPSAFAATGPQGTPPMPRPAAMQRPPQQTANQNGNWWSPFTTFLR